MFRNPPPPVDEEVVSQKLDKSAFLGLRAILIRLADVTERAGRAFSELNAETNAFQERTEHISSKLQQLQEHFGQTPVSALFEEHAFTLSQVQQDLKDQDVALKALWGPSLGVGPSPSEKSAAAGRVGPGSVLSAASSRTRTEKLREKASVSSVTQRMQQHLQKQASAAGSVPSPPASVSGLPPTAEPENVQQQVGPSSVPRLRKSFVGMSLHKSKTYWVAQHGPLWDADAAAPKRGFSGSDTQDGPLTRAMNNITNLRQSGEKVWPPADPNQPVSSPAHARLQTVNIPFSQEQAARASLESHDFLQQRHQTMTTMRSQAYMGGPGQLPSHPQTVSLPLRKGTFDVDLGPDSPMSGVPDGETTRERLHKTFHTASKVAEARGRSINMRGSISAMRDSFISQASSQGIAAAHAAQHMGPSSLRASQEELQHAFEKLRPDSPLAAPFAGSGKEQNSSVNQEGQMHPTLGRDITFGRDTTAGPSGTPGAVVHMQHTPEVSHRSVPGSHGWEHQGRPSSATSSKMQHHTPPGPQPDSRSPQDESRSAYATPQESFQDQQGRSPRMGGSQYQEVHGPGSLVAATGPHHQHRVDPSAMSPYAVDQQRPQSGHSQSGSHAGRPGQLMAATRAMSHTGNSVHSQPTHPGAPPAGPMHPMHGPPSHIHPGQSFDPRQLDPRQMPSNVAARGAPGTPGQHRGGSPGPYAGHWGPDGQTMAQPSTAGSQSGMRSVHSMQQPYPSPHPQSPNMFQGPPPYGPASHAMSQSSRLGPGQHLRAPGPSPPASFTHSMGSGIYVDPSTQRIQHPSSWKQRIAHPAAVEAGPLRRGRPSGASVNQPMPHPGGLRPPHMGQPGSPGPQYPPGMPPPHQYANSSSSPVPGHTQVQYIQHGMHSRNMPGFADHQPATPPTAGTVGGAGSPFAVSKTGPAPGQWAPPSPHAAPPGSTVGADHFVQPPSPHAGSQHGISQRQAPSPTPSQSGPAMRALPASQAAPPSPRHAMPTGAAMHPVPTTAPTQAALAQHTRDLGGGAALMTSPSAGSIPTQQHLPQRPQTAMSNASHRTTGSVAAAAAAGGTPAANFYLAAKAVKSGQLSPRSGTPPPPSPRQSGHPPASPHSMQPQMGMMQMLELQSQQQSATAAAGTSAAPATSVAPPHNPQLSPRSMPVQQQMAPRRQAQVMASMESTSTAAVSSVSRAAPQQQQQQTFPRGPGSTHSSVRPYSSRQSPSPPNSQRNTPTVAAARTMAHRAAGSAATSPAALAGNGASMRGAPRAAPMVSPRSTGKDTQLGSLMERARAMRAVDDHDDAWNDLGASQDTVASNN